MGPIPGIDYDVWVREASADEARRRRAIEHARALRDGRARRHAATSAPWSPAQLVARLRPRARRSVTLPQAGDQVEQVASVALSTTPTSKAP